MKTIAVRWLKFNLVGGIGIVVQLAALGLLVSGLGVPYLVATALAVEAAILHNFLWHERFTWVDRPTIGTGEALRRLARFNLSTGAISLAGNLLLMRLLVGQAHLHYFHANILTIVACSVINFLLSDRFAFRKAG